MFTTKTKILLFSLIYSFFLMPFAVQANSTGENFYDAQKFQQVCQDKNQGDQISFPFQGVIWNGSCELQFFPASPDTAITENEADLHSVCSADKNTKFIIIDEKQIKGKCALGYNPPRTKPQKTM